MRCSVLALDLDSPEAAVGLTNACFAAVAVPRSSANAAAVGGKEAAATTTMPLPPPPMSEGAGALPLSLPDTAAAAAANAVAIASPEATDHAAVEAAVLEILSTMLDEADDLPAPLVDAVLSPLLPPLRDARPGAARCARGLLKRCELKLQPAVQRLLVAAIESGGVGTSGAPSSSATSSTSATERAADLIAEVASTCPQALLPVLPKLQDELQVEDEGRRAGAIAIAVSLLSAGHGVSSSAAAAAGAGGGANDGNDGDENDDDDENPTTAAAAAAAAHAAHASLGASHAPLLDALLRRSRDRSASLRALVVKAVPGLLAGAPDSASRAAVLAAAAGRLLDLDERLRAAAVTAICTCAQGDNGGGVKAGDAPPRPSSLSSSAAAAAAPPPPASSSALLGLRSLGASSLQPLLAVGERLRDSSPGVARAAAHGLLSLFRAYAGALHRGEEVSSTEELVLWIPGKLLSAAAASADLRNFCVDLLFAKPPAVPGSSISALSSSSSSSSTIINPSSLLPARLSPKAVARQWTCIWMTCSPVERAAASALIRARGSAAGAAAEAAAARAALRAAGGLAAAELSKANGEEESSEARSALRRLNSAIVSLSVVFPWPDRARSVSALRALIAESKDNGVARALAALAAPGTRSVDAAAAAAELVARAPQGSAKEAAKILAARLSPSLLAPEVIPELFLAAAAPNGGGTVVSAKSAHIPAASAPDGRFAAAALSLLTDAATADASLFACAAPAVADAIAADDALLRAASLRVLAAAGGAMRRAADSDAAAAAAAAAAGRGGSGGDGGGKATRTSPRGSKRSNNANADADNDAAEDVLDALSDAAAEAAREGPPAACRTAVRALACLLPTEHAARVLRGVATRHVRHLASGAPAKALSDPRKTRVALAALGALGAAAPSVFATHAAAVSDFVMSVMLPAPAVAFGKGGALAASGGSGPRGVAAAAAALSAGALPPPSVAAAAKAEALEDLAAALVPDASSPLVLADAKAAAAAAGSSSSSPPQGVRIRATPEALAVADRLVPELAGLVDPDAAATDGSAAVAAAHAAIVVAASGASGDEELSPAARADAAALRTGAARALLTLLKAADSRVPSGAYIALSLVLQDQEADVRSAFRAALISAVDSTCRGGGGGGAGASSSSASSCLALTGTRASKLAAPLALSAVDPSKQAQHQALHAMQRFVAARREAVAQQMRHRAAAAARGGRGGGGGGGGRSGGNNPTTTTTTTTAAPPAAAAADSLLHEAPEFSLTYLLQILAHHPDFPPCGPATGGGPFPAAEELAPFAVSRI